ncbi:MAG: CDP-glucose 4,6-dehydratase [Clostridia bacterium]|nr:CDP-glucose 4,6-dehydratase [Clostridia bacterium]
MKDFSFYKGRRVFLTGHTGFKGTWMSRILVNAGAVLTGYSLEPPTSPSLFEMAGLQGRMNSVIGDIRDFEALRAAFEAAQPEIVIHMAAQPIVRDSYKDPRYTYETNVMGTVNLLECVRQSKCVRSFLNVTTDKVYLNREWQWGYREDEMLDGYDPYSNSKSCSELATHSYKNSFFNAEGAPAISTARAGNVIGGGDFANDRIIPDCVRAAKAGRDIVVRNPYSTRPYQHVLEPVTAYLMIAQRQWEDPSLAGWYNVGPDECDCVTTGRLVELFVSRWGRGLKWVNLADAQGPHEASFLKLDCSKIKSVFGWRPTWHIDETIEMTCAWTRVWLEGGDVPAEMDREIAEFMK